MVSSVQELVGLTKALDRLETRIKAYRAILLNISLGLSVKATNEEDAVSTGEVETVEALVRRFARRVTGVEPAESEWEPLHPYCSRNEEKKETWANQNYEYFRWALFWLPKTRTYLVVCQSSSDTLEVLVYPGIKQGFPGRCHGGEAIRRGAEYSGAAAA